jgi:Ca2+-binding RTX toxin-like protein
MVPSAGAFFGLRGTAARDGHPGRRNDGRGRVVQIYNVDSVGSGIRANLASSEDIFVANGVTLGSTDVRGILGTTSFHTANVQGTVFAEQIGIFLGPDFGFSAARGQRLIVGADAYVGSSSVGAAVLLGKESTAEIKGTLWGENYGLLMGGVSATTQSTVTNSGVIEGGNYGIVRDFSNQSTETLVIRNSGLVKSEDYAFSSLGTAASELITNTGEMVGAVQLGLGNDIYDGRSGRLQGDVFGGDGVDRIYGGVDNDAFYGDAGNDMLQGFAGHDTLNGGTGADQMAGGLGNDTFIVDNAGDKVLEASNQGIDAVRSSVSHVLSANVDHLVLLGAAAISGTGNVLNNVITGNGAANALNGGAGNDTLNGGAGHDTLNGGLGNDILTGGVGNDLFVFNIALNPTANIDRITDFNVPADTIRLDNAVMPGLGTALGTLAAGKFWKGTSGLAHDADDRIIYETDTGKLYYDANGKAAGGGILFATLAPYLALTSADFQVV